MQSIVVLTVAFMSASYSKTGSVRAMVLGQLFLARAAHIIRELSDKFHHQNPVFRTSENHRKTVQAQESHRLSNSTTRKATIWHKNPRRMGIAGRLVRPIRRTTKRRLSIDKSRMVVQTRTRSRKVRPDLIIRKNRHNEKTRVYQIRTQRAQNHGTIERKSLELAIRHRADGGTRFRIFQGHALTNKHPPVGPEANSSLIVRSCQLTRQDNILHDRLRSPDINNRKWNPIHLRTRQSQLRQHQKVSPTLGHVFNTRGGRSRSKWHPIRGSGYG